MKKTPLITFLFFTILLNGLQALADEPSCQLDLQNQQWTISHCIGGEVHPASMENFVHALRAALEMPKDFSAVIKREPRYYGANKMSYQLRRQTSLLLQAHEASNHLQRLIEEGPWDQVTKSRWLKTAQSIRNKAMKSFNQTDFLRQHNELVKQVLNKIQKSKNLHAQWPIGQAPSVLAGIFASKIFASGDFPLDMKTVPAGSYTVGTSASEPRPFKDETERKVDLKAAFTIQADLFTQAQWFHLVGSNPSQFKNLASCPESHTVEMSTELCPDYPVENVSAKDVQWALQILNSSGGPTYHLPTEEEWEIAARAGASTIYWFGDDTKALDENIYYESNANEQTHKVSSKKRNPWGLGDSSGHVWQMTSDKKDSEDSYKVPPHTDLYLVKGGSWTGAARIVRPETRLGIGTEERYSNVGFRLAGEAKP